jgi:3,4-dihydroxy 2-butanone 4-phosphate synthase/GTP cyclohydrolase II
VIVLLHRPESGQDILAILREPVPPKRPAARWDPRIYGIGAQILRDLGVGKMKLLSPARAACRA